MDTRTRTINELRTNLNVLSGELKRACVARGKQLADASGDARCDECRLLEAAISRRAEDAGRVKDLLESLEAEGRNLRAIERELASIRASKADLARSAGRTAYDYGETRTCFAPFRERAAGIEREIRDIELSMEASRIEAAKRGFFGAIVQGGKIALKKVSLGGKRQEIERALSDGGKVLLDSFGSVELSIPELSAVLSAWRELSERERSKIAEADLTRSRIDDIRATTASVTGSKSPRAFIADTAREVDAGRRKLDSMYETLAMAEAEISSDGDGNDSTLARIATLKGAIARDSETLARLEAAVSLDELALRRARAEARFNAARKREDAFESALKRHESEIALIDAEMASIRGKLGVGEAVVPDDDFDPPDLRP